MADHHFVELAEGWLNNNWDTSNYPGGSFSGSQPAIVDGDNADSQDFNGRQVKYDLTKNNAVVLKSTPDRTQEIIGTEFDYRFDDGISIEVAGLYDGDEYGHITSAAEFRALYQEVRRVLHAQRDWPDRNQSGSQHTDTLWIADESNLSDNYHDLFLYDMTVLFRGFEELS